MSTIKDVATLAGVAVSTVSAVINRSAPVSEDMIKRVEAAVLETGYVPHGGARSLRLGQSRVVGLILPDITNPHFATVARVVESVCLAAGYLAAVYSTEENHDTERRILDMMRMQRVEGLIIIPTRSDAEHGSRLLHQIHVPTILLDSFVDGLPYDVVKLDNVAAGRIGTEHLLALGHTRIAITTGRDNIATGEDRLAGYLQAHAAQGIPVDRSLFLPGQFDQATARASTFARMTEAHPPTAIFALSNMMTLGVLNALHDLNLSVPNDVSVLGIDDFDFANIMNPPPTVVAAPVQDMAKAAISGLLHAIKSKSPPTASRELFEPRLVLRNSCKAPG